MVKVPNPHAPSPWNLLEYAVNRGIFFSHLVLLLGLEQPPRPILILNPSFNIPPLYLDSTEGVRPDCYTKEMIAPVRALPATLEPAPGFKKQNFQEFYIHWPWALILLACPLNSQNWKHLFLNLTSRLCCSNSACSYYVMTH